MQTDKNNQSSSDSKGAETDFRSEVTFSHTQRREIEQQAEAFGDHEELMKFPLGSVFVCERVYREPSTTLHMIRQMTDEYSRVEMEEFMLEMLLFGVCNDRDDEDKTYTVHERTVNHWVEMFKTLSAIYDDSQVIEDLTETELRSVACLH